MAHQSEPVRSSVTQKTKPAKPAIECAIGSFARVRQVKGTEGDRREHGRRPESDTARQSREQIAAGPNLLGQADQEEANAQPDRIDGNGRAMQQETVEGQEAQDEKQSNETGMRTNPHSAPAPNRDSHRASRRP